MTMADLLDKHWGFWQALYVLIVVAIVASAVRWGGR